MASHQRQQAALAARATGGSRVSSPPRSRFCHWCSLPFDEEQRWCLQLMEWRDEDHSRQDGKPFKVSSGACLRQPLECLSCVLGNFPGLAPEGGSTKIDWGCYPTVFEALREDGSFWVDHGSDEQMFTSIVSGKWNQVEAESELTLCNIEGDFNSSYEWRENHHVRKYHRQSAYERPTSYASLQCSSISEEDEDEDLEPAGTNHLELASKNRTAARRCQHSAFNRRVARATEAERTELNGRKTASSDSDSENSAEEEDTEFGEEAILFPRRHERIGDRGGPEEDSSASVESDASDEVTTSATARIHGGATNAHCFRSHTAPTRRQRLAEEDEDGSIYVKGVWYPRQTSGRQFRELSKTRCRAPERKIGADATYIDQDAAHRVPNCLYNDAYNHSRGQPGVQRNLMAAAHAPGNITYSAHNKEHTVRENRLYGSDFSAADVRAETHRFKAGLRSQRESSSTASARLMAAARRSGEGMNSVVAHLDQRTFNSPAEKRSIDAARASDPTYSGINRYSSGSGGRVPYSGYTYTNSHGTTVNVPAGTRAAPG